VSSLSGDAVSSLSGDAVSSLSGDAVFSSFLSSSLHLELQSHHLELQSLHQLQRSPHMPVPLLFIPDFPQYFP